MTVILITERVNEGLNIIAEQAIERLRVEVFFDLDGVADYEHNEVYTKVVWEKFKRNSIQVLKLFPETSIYFYTKIY